MISYRKYCRVTTRYSWWRNQLVMVATRSTFSSSQNKPASSFVTSVDTRRYSATTRWFGVVLDWHRLVRQPSHTHIETSSEWICSRLATLSWPHDSTTRTYSSRTRWMPAYWTVRRGYFTGPWYMCLYKRTCTERRGIFNRGFLSNEARTSEADWRDISGGQGYHVCRGEINCICSH